MNSFLYVCSRPSFEVSKTAGIIGFHDSVATLNRVLAEVQVGDRVYFYITREMRLAARARVTREVFLDASPIFASVGKYEIFARRIGIEVEKDDLALPFRESVVPKLTDLFPPNRKAVFSAYLVSQFIRLSPQDAAVLEKRTS
jgi:hypothetical protein